MFNKTQQHLFDEYSEDYVFPWIRQLFDHSQKGTAQEVAYKMLLAAATTKNVKTFEEETLKDYYYKEEHRSIRKILISLNLFCSPTSTAHSKYFQAIASPQLSNTETAPLSMEFSEQLRRCILDEIALFLNQAKVMNGARDSSPTRMKIE